MSFNKEISESRKLLNQESKSKDKDKPSDILADIELEFERRHAAKSLKGISRFDEIQK